MILARKAALITALVCGSVTAAFARDDGRYAQNPLKPWFDSLRSSKGYCCSDADGRETQYDIRKNAEGKESYWVPLPDAGATSGVTWTEVPDDAVITEPNKLGRPMLWLDPRQNIRCFIPGAGL